MRHRCSAQIAAGFLVLTVLAMVVSGAPPAAASSAEDINRGADTALAKLYASVPSARPLGQRAKGILIFPEVVKAGFMFGAQYGDGALRRRGKTVGYYNTVAGSYGLQAGAQKFGYALFFMSDSALAYLDKSEGFEIGVGPSIVVVDAGKAVTHTTSTVQHDIYAFIFDQRGLMAGLGLQGSKITRIER
jgi:lipid-binding SYLF domain-containing protein